MHLLLRQIKFTRTDVFVGVKLDLLEADHARHHVHLAVQRHVGRVRREAIQDGDLRVGDGRRVVIAVHFLHVRLATDEVKFFHLENLALDHVDGLGMQRRQGTCEVGFANHLGAVRVIGNHEVIGRDRSQAHGVGRVRLARPVPLPRLVFMTRPVHESRLLQHAQHLLHVDLAIGLIGGERQLEGRALHVIHQDVEIVGIDQRVFRRGIEEVRRMPHDKLIDWRARRHHDGRRLTGPTAGTTGTLPGGGDGPRISGHHADVQGADVDAELERVGGHDAAHLTSAQTLLDLAPPQRQVATAIAANAFGHARHVFKVFFQVGRQDLGGEPALREHDHLEVAPQELTRHTPRFRHVRAPNPQLAIDHRRIDEHEELLAPRRAAPAHERERPLREPLRQLQRIGDGRRRTDELRVRSVVTANALQPSQHVGEVAAKHAAVGMQFVDDDELEVLEQLGPAWMVREDPGVQHVGIAEDDLSLAADGAARILRRVAVVGVHADLMLFASNFADGADQFVQLRHLILRQRLGREQIQRARCRVLQDAIENWQVVAERLARRGRCGDHHLLALGNEIEGLGLVRVELLDTSRLERRAQARVDAGGKRRIGRLDRRQPPDCGHDFVRGVRAVELRARRQDLERALEGELLMFERAPYGERRLV